MKIVTPTAIDAGSGHSFALRYDLNHRNGDSSIVIIEPQTINIYEQPTRDWISQMAASGAITNCSDTSRPELYLAYMENIAAEQDDALDIEAGEIEILLIQIRGGVPCWATHMNYLAITWPDAVCAAHRIIEQFVNHNTQEPPEQTEARLTGSL